jgi:hypothetical protein
VLGAAIIAVTLGLSAVAYGVVHATGRSTPMSAQTALPKDTGTGTSAAPSPSPSLSPSPTVDQDAIAATQRSIQSYLASKGRHAAVGALDLVTGAQVVYNPTLQFETASIVKADILSTLLYQLQKRNSHLSASQRALATRMITQSDNNAASALWTQIGRGTGLAAANKVFGFTRTIPGKSGSWGLTKTSVSDQLKLLQVLTKSSSPLSAASRAYILGLMSHVESDQRWGVPHAAGSAATAVYVKNGWLSRSADGFKWIINTIGRIVEPGHDWLVVVLTNFNATMSGGITVVQKAADLAVDGLSEG